MLLNQPGVYPDVPMGHYHASPAVNARLAQVILSGCPATAFYESFLNPNRVYQDSSDTLDAGAITHALLLEGDYSRAEIIDPNDHPAKSTGAIPAGWTNASIRAARDAARANGRLPILKSAFAAIRAQVDAAREYIEGVRLDEPAIHAAFQPDGGASELSIFWDDAGTLFRIRPDRINRERALIVDYKSTDSSAEPVTWGRAQMTRLGFYMNAAFYLRGIRATFGTNPAYCFLVQEREPPYLCSLVGLDPAALALGDAKVDYALKLWRKCATSRIWPAYPPRVCYPSLPPWEAARWEEYESTAFLFEPDVANLPKPGEGAPQ